MDKLDKLARELLEIMKADTEASIHFVVVHADRMRALGVSEDDITTLGYIAIREANGVTMFPGMIMRDFANAIEAGAITPAGIIKHFEEQNKS